MKAKVARVVDRPALSPSTDHTGSAHSSRRCRKASDEYPNGNARVNTSAPATLHTRSVAVTVAELDHEGSQGAVG